ncbi:MAG: hypothetical protein KAW89_01665, partial [Armatimonadetes bacterium]|nr:hypothetical protein [Armatimonadota bacterium]
TLGLMTEGQTLKEIGESFEALCSFLRDNNRGCQWPSMSYLMFLRDRYRFPPIHPGNIQALLDSLGVSHRIYGHVSWYGYRAVLRVADQLWDDLAVYDPRHIIDIQSYMYVLGATSLSLR